MTRTLVTIGIGLTLLAGCTRNQPTPAPRPARLKQSKTTERPPAEPAEPQVARAKAEETPPAPTRKVEPAPVEQPVASGDADPAPVESKAVASPQPKQKKPEFRAERATLANGVPVLRVFDARDRLVGVFGKGYEETFAYDDDDFLRMHTTPDGRRVMFDYDERGFLRETVGPAGVTRFQRDRKGQILKLTTPGDRAWSFLYDGERVAAEDGPMGRVEYGYDRKGRRIKVKDASGRETYIVRDARARTLDLSNADGHSLRHVFDLAGRLASAKSDAHQLTYGYDAQGRMASIKGPQGTLRYARAGAHETLHTPWGKLVRVRDAAGRMVRLVTPAGTFKFEYDLAGRRTALHRPSGLVTRAKHDGLGRVVSLQDKALDWQSGFDRRHERSFVTRDGETTRFRYDHAGRVVRVSRSKQTVRTYGYDDDGNRIGETRGKQASKSSFDLRGRITRRGEVAFKHDGAGRLVAAGKDTFRYDGFGRLVEVRRAGAPKVTYGYDALNRIARRTVSGKTTHFVYEGMRLLAEVGPGTRVRLYVHGPELTAPLAYVEDGRWTYLHSNDQGHVLAYSDANGKRVAQAEFAPFGEVRTAPKGDRPMFFAGQRYDRVAKVVPMRARVYDPALGRFLTPDPSGLKGGTNAYVYVKNNPLDLVDPLGLFSVPLASVASVLPITTQVGFLSDMLSALSSGAARKLPPAQERPTKADVRMWKMLHELEKARTKRYYRNWEQGAKDLLKVMEQAPLKPHLKDGFKQVIEGIDTMEDFEKAAQRMRYILNPTKDELEDPAYTYNAFVEFMETVKDVVDKVPAIGKVVGPVLGVYLKLMQNGRKSVDTIGKAKKRREAAVNNVWKDDLANKKALEALDKKLRPLATKFGKELRAINPLAKAKSWAQGQIAAAKPTKAASEWQLARMRLNKNRRRVAKALEDEASVALLRQTLGTKSVRDWLQERLAYERKQLRKAREAKAEVRKKVKDYLVAKHTYEAIEKNPEKFYQGYNEKRALRAANRWAERVLRRNPNFIPKTLYPSRKAKRPDYTSLLAKHTPKKATKPAPKKPGRMKIGRSDGTKPPRTPKGVSGANGERPRWGGGNAGGMVGAMNR